MSTPKKKKRYKLRDLDIDRVDLVDRGANQHAHIIINKSHTPEHPEQIGDKWDPKSLVAEVKDKKKDRKGSAFPEQVAADSSSGYAKHASHDQDDHGNWSTGSSGPKGRKVKNRPPTSKETPWIPRWEGDDDEPDEEDPGDRPIPRWRGRGENDYDDDGVSRREADEMADRDADRYERYMRKAFPNIMDKKNPDPNAPTQVPPGSAPAPKLREDDDTKNGENPRDKLAQFMQQRAAAKEKAAPPQAPTPTPGTPAPAVAAGQAAAPASRAPGAPPGAKPGMPMGGAPGARPGQPAPPQAAPAPPQAPPQAPAPQQAPPQAPQRPQMPKTSGDLAAMMQSRRNPPQPPR